MKLNNLKCFVKFFINNNPYKKRKNELPFYYLDFDINWFCSKLQPCIALHE